jgi:hypothetical protein
MPHLHDIAHILADWPFEPGSFDVRLIEADDGRPLLQVRIDLGLVQMELHDRPDGTRPNGHASVLGGCRAQFTNDPSTFAIDEATAQALHQEALQVVTRCRALFMLGNSERVMHDADEILQRLELCRTYAQASDDTTRFEALRPQAITMRSRAAAELAMAADNSTAARQALTSGLHDLEACLDATAFKHGPEVQLLQGMHALLVPRLPSSQRVELQARLATALRHEHYELAAILRDELRQLPD